METIRGLLCTPPAPPPPKVSTQAYLCVGRICAKANFIGDSAPPEALILPVPEISQVISLFIALTVSLGVFLTLIALRSTIRKYVSAIASECTATSASISILVSSIIRATRYYLNLGYLSVEAFFYSCSQSVYEIAHERHPRLIGDFTSLDGADVFSDSAKKQSYIPGKPTSIDESFSSDADDKETVFGRSLFANGSDPIVSDTHTGQESLAANPGASPSSVEICVFDHSNLGTNSGNDGSLSQHTVRVAGRNSEGCTSELSPDTETATTREPDHEPTSHSSALTEGISENVLTHQKPASEPSLITYLQDVPEVAWIEDLPPKPADSDIDGDNSVLEDQALILRDTRGRKALENGKIPSRRDKQAMRKVQNAAGKLA